MTKVRLDSLLADKGLAESRSQAQRIVMAGQVRVDGQLVIKPAMLIDQNAQLEIILGPPFVSRGGEKLRGALDHIGLDVRGLVCADVGASTGGFTDCLLQSGASKVYAIDVGQGILHWKLRQNPRVVVMERTNARYVERLPEVVNLVTVDAAFISLKILLPVIRGWFFGVNEEDKPAGQVLALVKPQFEAGKKVVARGSGVIRDPQIHQEVLQDVLSFAVGQGYSLQGLTRSPLRGPKGNAEFFAWLIYPGQLSDASLEWIEQLIAQVTFQEAS